MARRGNPNWQKGVSGNPGGRPKRGPLELGDARAMQAGFQELTEEAREALRRALRNPKTSVQAATAILNRAWGNPVQPIEQDGQLQLTLGGIDGPERPETAEEWVARRERELAALGTATGASAARH